MSRKKIYLFANPLKMRALMEAQQIASLLKAAGTTVLCEPALTQTFRDAEPFPLSDLSGDTDALIAVGGDGTLL